MPSDNQKESSSNQVEHGGRRPGAGRRKGGKNAATLEIEAAARAHAGDAIQALVYVAKKGKSESARVSAATALIERGYGKAKQAVEHTGEDGGPIEIAVTHEIIDPASEGQS